MNCTSPEGERKGEVRNGGRGIRLNMSLKDKGWIAKGDILHLGGDSL